MTASPEPRSTTRNLALQLAGPPRRVETAEAPTSAVHDISVRAETAPSALDEPRSLREVGLLDDGIGAVASSKPGKNAKAQRAPKPSSATAPASEASALTVTLDADAYEALQHSRASGRTVREAMLLAVRATHKTMEPSRPEMFEADDDLPMVQLRPRRRLDDYGTKVPVRFYGPERAALQVIADRLGRSLSGLISDALRAERSS